VTKSFEHSLHLQFAPTQTEGLARRYSDDESKALEAGQRIAHGYHTRANLEIIFDWKTGGRGKSRLLGNTDSEIKDALRLAISARTERAAIAVLRGLDGVDVPVASAIMTAIKPKLYTVIDIRALQSLGTRTTCRSIDFYVAYLKYCRDLASQYKVKLRTLDRALWQWSNERQLSKASHGF
jgi:hypothetical protein